MHPHQSSANRPLSIALLPYCFWSLNPSSRRALGLATVRTESQRLSPQERRILKSPNPPKLNQTEASVPTATCRITAQFSLFVTLDTVPTWCIEASRMLRQITEEVQATRTALRRICRFTWAPRSARAILYSMRSTEYAIARFIRWRKHEDQGPWTASSLSTPCHQ